MPDIDVEVEMIPKLQKQSKVERINTGDFTVPNVKLYRKAVVTESVYQWRKKIYTQAKTK